MNTNNIPRWAIEEYEGSEKDFAIWIEKAYFETKYKEQYNQLVDPGTGEIVNQGAYEELKALAKFSTLEHTIQMTGMVERSQIWQLCQANETGWYRYLPAEFDSLEELLAGMVDAEEEGSSTWYDLTFLATQLVPMLKEAGAEAGKFFGLTKNTKKARAAVPLMRQIIRENSDKSTKEIMPERVEAVRLSLLNIANQIVDENIGSTKFIEDIKQIRHGITEAPPCITEARHYILNGGKEIFVIEVENRTQVRTIEMALRNIVPSMMISDVNSLFKYVQGIVKKITPEV